MRTEGSNPSLSATHTSVLIQTHHAVVETVTLHYPGLKGWPGWTLFFVWTHLVIALHADLRVFGDSYRGGAYI